ncbi:hypothetical protein Pelo_11026 [Pelomyxa schiedti]|nr:hypothetical protein Pelo_11026 [Pelomyxa schiedti]
MHQETPAFGSPPRRGSMSKSTATNGTATTARTPRIAVYVNRDYGAQRQYEDTNEIIGILSDCGVTKKDVKIYDCALDQPLFLFLLNQNGGSVVFPQIYIFGQKVGTVSELNTLFSSGKLKQMLAKPPAVEKPTTPVKTSTVVTTSSVEAPSASATTTSTAAATTTATSAPIPIPGSATSTSTSVSTSPTPASILSTSPMVHPPEFPTTLTDRWIDGAEWLLRGLAHAFGGVKEDPTREDALKQRQEKKTPLDVDFVVLRTNWYWRHQKRIFRLSLDNFFRLDPESFEVRETFNYREVEQITISDERHVVIKFVGNRHYPEYIETPQASEMASLIIERAGPGATIKLVRQ